MRMIVSIKYTETDSSFSQISADGQSDGCQPVIRERISPSNDGKHVDSRRETTNDVRLRLRQYSST
jgi:hypothetical protein